jgi:rhodanese-related sulfurtransferase
MSWKDFFSPAKNIEAGELRAYIDANPEGSFTLLDVRQPAEYEGARIPGSRLLPLPELSERAAGLDPSRPVIVY